MSDYYDYYAEQQEQERYNRELDREFERNQRWEEDHRHNMLMWDREQEQYRNSQSSRDSSYTGWSGSAASDDRLNAFVMVAMGFLALWLQTLNSTLAVAAAVLIAVTVVITKIEMSRNFLLNIPLFLIGLGGKVVALLALVNWLCSIF